MKRFTLGEDRIVHYIGAHEGCPAVHRETGEPYVLFPLKGEDEHAYRRVGWAEFFFAVRQRGYVFLYEDPGGGPYDARFVPRKQALRELGVKRSSLFKHSLELLKGLPVPAGH